MTCPNFGRLQLDKSFLLRVVDSHSVGTPGLGALHTAHAMSLITAHQSKSRLRLAMFSNAGSRSVPPRPFHSTGTSKGKLQRSKTRSALSMTRVSHIIIVTLHLLKFLRIISISRNAASISGWLMLPLVSTII